MKLMVTGATGNLGALVVEALLKTVPPKSIAVSVRDPKKAEHLSDLGVDVRYGNFNEYESLVAAFAGIDRLLIISSGDLQNRIEQHMTAIRAAKEANVGFIVYTSAPNATDSQFDLAKDHRETEEAIKKSGIPYSFLRNNWYLENEMGTFQAVLNGAPWAVASGSGKLGWAARRDYAEAAAHVLAGQGHENTTYELSGKLLTQDELASIFEEAMNREVRVLHLDDESYGKMLGEVGVPEAVIPFLISMQRGIREGGLDVESKDLQQLLGRPATPLSEAIRQMLS
ncbi:SDR family oxidoreductase [Paenibacillus radicis (ex Xue et al. 2023)]|uniref:SDR family oxidoreductase n=1 Tax=Paenibacillus radicis (ex Xue et al. 2023) TaxID=2972489 RepID=A0ABT1YHU8_9BACL|nr:SDR family oxidoreductase [Paenibacillus radicis (ex Xue et al. 2023)]MCR8632766.1 SDR family oxidoreductase [Paenibacillus radicis (ex Xue et al. 2023)]